MSKTRYNFDLEKSVKLLNEGKSFRAVASELGFKTHTPWFKKLDKARDKGDVIFFPGKWVLKNNKKDGN